MGECVGSNNVLSHYQVTGNQVALSYWSLNIVSVPNILIVQSILVTNLLNCGIKTLLKKFIGHVLQLLQKNTANIYSSKT